MAKVKEENFITIHGWMITRLGLSGASLIIYAVIYGFSQDGESFFQGSRQYLADWCNCSLSGVKKCLRQLQDSGLIEQIYHSKDNQDVYYRAHIEPVSQSVQGLGHKVTEAMAQSDLGGMTKVTEARAQSDLPIKDDNIVNNIADNIVDNIVVDTSTPAPFKIPTIEAVKTFAERHGKAVVDPVTFFEYYQANGWKVGKNKMKDWRAAFRMWEARERKEKAPADKVRIMENEYTPEHLAHREADSIKLLDDLLREE